MILLAIVVAIIIFEVYAYKIRLLNTREKTVVLNNNIVANETFNGKKSTNNLKTTIESDKLTLIGTNQNGKSVYTNDEAKHIFVCGTTGSGKTVCLSNFINTAITKDYPALIIDGKGDIGDGSILQITKKLVGQHNKKLYVINLVNPKESDKYNPFRESTSTISKDMLINMSEWSEEHYKLNTERFLQRLFVLMELLGIPFTFNNILKNLNTESFEFLSATLTKQEKITKHEHLHNLEISKASGKIAESAAARFLNLSESELGVIFDDNGIDVYTALKENSIILFILNPLLYPEVSPMFGKLVLIDSNKAVSKLFGNNDKRIFFILDEINTYASTTLVNLINKSRSANVTVIPATQSLADLEIVSGEAFREQIIENCNNYIIMRQNSSKGAELWSKIIGTAQSMEVTHQIGSNNNSDTSATGVGSAKLVREFIYHPDEIKSLRTGKAIYLSRDENKHTKVNINKPF